MSLVPANPFQHIPETSGQSICHVTIKISTAHIRIANGASIHLIWSRLLTLLRQIRLVASRGFSAPCPSLASELARAVVARSPDVTVFRSILGGGPSAADGGRYLNRHSSGLGRVEHVLPARLWCLRAGEGYPSAVSVQSISQSASQQRQSWPVTFRSRWVTTASSIPSSAASASASTPRCARWRTR